MMCHFYEILSFSHVLRNFEASHSVSCLCLKGCFLSAVNILNCANDVRQEISQSLSISNKSSEKTNMFDKEEAMAIVH